MIRQASAQQDEDISMTHGDESYVEIHTQKHTLTNPKITRRIGTWDVRIMSAPCRTAHEGHEGKETVPLEQIQTMWNRCKKRSQPTCH